MYQDENERCACNIESPVPESDVFATLARIDQKIVTIDNVLSPIMIKYPALEETKEAEPSTELLKRLKFIERRLSILIDSISL